MSYIKAEILKDSSYKQTKANSADFSSTLESDLKKQPNYSFLLNIPVRNVPFIDSTNFNNYRQKKPLSEKEIDLLNLKKITSANYQDAEKTYVNYRLNLSKNFLTLVLSSHSGAELLTYLINYNENFEVIDHLLIAYDETAENWFQTQCYITKDKITVKNISHVELNPGIKIQEYAVLTNGKISKK